MNYYMAGKRSVFSSMSEALRYVIAESDMSFKGLERETGVTRQSLMKFMAGEQSLRLDKADQIAAYFRLSIVKRKGR